MIAVSEKSLTVLTLPSVMATKGTYATTSLNSPGLHEDLEIGRIPRSRKDSEATQPDSAVSLYGYDGDRKKLPKLPSEEDPLNLGLQRPIRFVLAGDSYLSFNSGTDCSTDAYREAGSQ